MMRLFCYGTLMFPEVMQRLGGGHFEGVAAIPEELPANGTVSLRLL